MKGANGAQLELSFSSCSKSLPSASMVSTTVVSSVEEAVVGLSCGFSEGSTTVAPRLVLHPMSWSNGSRQRAVELSPQAGRVGKSYSHLQTRASVVSSGASALHGNFLTSFWGRSDLRAGFILPLFADSSSIIICAGWELTAKHDTTWLLINTEGIVCQPWLPRWNVHFRDVLLLLLSAV